MKSKRKLHISAGGVVYRQRNQKIEVVLLYRRASKSWHLPKGTKKPKEKRRETAVREIKEETGVSVKLQKYLGWLPSIWYSQDGTKIFKKTHYYLTKPLTMNIQDHDQEHDKVKWVEINQAKKLLAKLQFFEKEDKNN